MTVTRFITIAGEPKLTVVFVTYVNIVYKLRIETQQSFCQISVDGSRVQHAQMQNGFADGTSVAQIPTHQSIFAFVCQGFIYQINSYVLRVIF